MSLRPRMLKIGGRMYGMQMQLRLQVWKKCKRFLHSSRIRSERNQCKKTKILVVFNSNISGIRDQMNNKRYYLFSAQGQETLLRATFVSIVINQTGTTISAQKILNVILWQVIL